MTFRDVNYINYQNLLSTTKHQAPYRDSGNAYPLGDRKYSTRHFRKEADGSFSLWYANRERADRHVTGTEHEGEKRWSDYMENSRIGVVRPDNSFEFTARGYGQGDNMMLSEGLAGHLYNDVTRGGLMLTKGRFFHPVFRGLRIDCSSGKAVTDYKIFRRVLDRKKANEYMKQYDQFKRVGPVMYQSLNDDGIAEVYDDLLNEYGREFDTLGDVEAMRMVKEGKYVDAICVFAFKVTPGLKHFAQERARAKADGEPLFNRFFHWYPRSRVMTLKRIKDSFRDIAVAEDESLFDYEELEVGHKPPSSKWAYKITVDGVQVERV